MFFGSDEPGSGNHAEKYEDIMKITAEADRLGFTAVWTPERHFQRFGRVFPNPSVLSAALAVTTERIGIRAGSVVLPLHNPVRVVEDWAIVDNLSRGRIGISVASGWHSTDFVLAPDHYADRKARALRDLALIRRLWAGEAVELPDGTGSPVRVRPAPRPVSATLPLWLTSSGRAETWEVAGRAGTNILGSTLGQTRAELAEGIRRYREVYDGPNERGTVTLMAHTYVGRSDAEVRRLAKAPLMAYISSFVSQTANDRGSGVDADMLTEPRRERLAEFAFQRYLTWGSLLGSAEKCRDTLRDLEDLDVDEVACLVDFGIETSEVLAGLRRLAETQECRPAG